MENSGGGTAGGARSDGRRADDQQTVIRRADDYPADDRLSDDALAVGLVVVLERMVALLRSLSQPDQLSMTSASTLSTLNREGPCRLTALATRQGVTQPAMTQLIARLQESGLVRREPDPVDGRVVQVSITAEGKALIARRREQRSRHIAALLAQLDPGHRAALAAALPAMDALAAAPRGEPPPA
jgi:DNA-binding MarR family transcriptional regulator